MTLGTDAAAVLPGPPLPEWRRVLDVGMRGEDVAAWQRVLMRWGYDLSPWNADGDFGALTRKRTIRFQLDRGLTPDGRVGPETRANVETSAKRPSPEDPWPFLQAANWRWANRSELRVIVVHTMEAPEKPTTAEAVASWFAGYAGAPPRASAHICVDNDSIVRCVRPEHVAWGAPGANYDGFQVELAGRASQTAGDWGDGYSTAMLELAAGYLARVARRWGVPIRKLDVAGVKRGDRGFCGHVEVSEAFRRSTHTDPGRGFPWGWFVELVGSRHK